MLFFKVKRKTKLEKRYSTKMGELITTVVYVKYYLFGVPLKTIHSYRETYYGEIKSCDTCNIYA